jgi:hypothetical protein
MRGSTLARIKRVIAPLARIRSAIRDPGFDPFGAVIVMLIALAWRLAMTVISNPDILIVVPLVMAFIVLVAAMFLGVGGAGWLISLLIQSLVRWRFREEIRPGMVWTEIALVIGAAIFLGVPSLYDAVIWWQEHFLRFLPYETAALDAAGAFYRSHAETILGLVIMAAIGCGIFWPIFRNFRAKFRTGTMMLKDLTRGRSLRVPAFLGFAMVVTLGLIMHHASDLLAAILCVEIAAMVLWLLAPAFLYYFILILAAVAWFVPALIVKERVNEQSNFWYFVVAVIWGAWLWSPFFIRAWPWRIPYWVGVLGLAAYIVH